MARVNFARKAGVTLIVVSFLAGAAIVLAILFLKNPSSSEKLSGKGVYGFDDMFSDNYSISGYSVKWISDSEYTRSPGGIVSITNLSDNSSRVLIPREIMSKYNVSFYWLSPDRHWILLACNYEKLYRRSFFADYFVYQVKNKTVHSRVTPPNPNKKIQLAMWGNKDSSIGFVQDNNIFWMDKVGSQPRRITNNGKENELFNGVPDWVYEEDVTLTNLAMWFSPDGRFLCFAESNDTQVVWFPYMWYGEISEAYSSVRKLAYPKAGTPNPVVKIKLVDLKNLPVNANQIPIAVDLSQPVDFSNTEYYYTNVAWVSNTTVLVWWLNRIQNTSIASICMASSWTCIENQRLTVKNGWVSAKTYLPPNPWFANNRSYYLSLLPSPQGDKGNFIHLAKVTVPSSGPGSITFLTEGAWEVASILGFNKQRDTVYIQSTETSPRERHIHSVNLNTKKKECLSCNLPWAENGACKFFQASFSLDSSWYILGCFGPDVPRFTLHNTSLRTWYKELEMNVKLQENMKKLSTPKRRNFRIPAGDYELMANEFLPPDFDENKKYAVQFQVYGGPGSQRVRETFTLGWITYLVSNFNLIVVQVDGRGTGYRGERFKQAVYKLLGEYEAQDVITAGRFMQKRKYVDASKLSIWGWSYGGFLTTYVLSKDTGVFKSGIAVAPVTDWRYYDSAYTERYMQLPQVNPDGYKGTSLLSRAAHFSNVDYLIIHGSGDDNVHYQNTAQMVKVLTEAEVHFRVQYYTDKDHGIIGQHTRRHLYRLMTNFLKKSLKLA